MTGGRPLLEVRNLVKYFHISGGLFGGREGVVRAVDDVSFAIHRGETLGLVGESGCGKTTTGRCILQLERPTHGQILFEGRDLATLGREELRAVRRRLQVIFQDPYSSLNPRMTVGQIVAEPLAVHRIVPDPVNPYTRALLSAVPIPDPELESRREHIVLGGEVPSPLNPPAGCVFHPRCPIAIDRCRAAVPELREIRPGHWAACILA